MKKRIFRYLFLMALAMLTACFAVLVPVIYRESVMSADKSAVLDFSDKIEHFLCSADSKRRNNHIPAFTECFPDDLCEFLCESRCFFMKPVTVC